MPASIPTATDGQDLSATWDRCLHSVLICHNKNTDQPDVISCSLRAKVGPGQAAWSALPPLLARLFLAFVPRVQPLMDLSGLETCLPYTCMLSSILTVMEITASYSLELNATVQRLLFIVKIQLTALSLYNGALLSPHVPVNLLGDFHLDELDY